MLLSAWNILNAQELKEVDFTAFCYHDVRNDVFGKLYPDSNALNTQHLIQHFQWLKDNDYTVISRKTLQDAKDGLITLPTKAVLLTFDDGFNSFYETIFPILRTFEYPATFAIVTDWIENNDHTIPYGKKSLSAKDFITWEQIKEISDSGLIEIASHSHNLHQGVVANPQLNVQPSATSRIYNSGYESDEFYRQRIKNDLQSSIDLIKLHTGKAPQTIVWPYGSYSDLIWSIAKDLGFESSLTLGTGENTLHGNEHIDRHLIDENPSLKEFKNYFKVTTHKFPQRVMHIDLDYVYDKDPIQQEKNLGLMLERVKKMTVNTVYLQAFADSDGDGNADALYFDNEYLPIKSDLFNRAAWQLRTRANVKVYAWMPVSSFVFNNDPELQNELGVYAWKDGKIIPSQANYKRLSIFNPKAREIIFSIYHSLAKHSKFAGILYHDDAFLSDFEDLSNDALVYYKQAGINFTNPEDLIYNKEHAIEWSELKTQALIEFTNELTAIIARYQPEIKTARNIYAQVITNPISEYWFAQNFEQFVKNYDYTAVMAMPFMEQQAKPIKWLTKLAKRVSNLGLEQEKIVFELQTKDWLTGKNIDTKLLVKQMKILQKMGIANYGYYPDDFIANHPDFKTIVPFMSLATFPFYKR